jgi:hypothetical protein
MCREGADPEGNRAVQERLVNEDRAQAALVFDGDVAVAWCEYGTPQDTDGKKTASFIYNGTRSLSSKPASAASDATARTTA